MNMFDPSTKVLIVDDMATMRRIIVKSCAEIGFENFYEAEDGVTAWDVLTKNPKIGLVICDWNMPNESGLDFLKKIRSSEEFKKMPFVLLTAESEVAQVREALAAGVDNYMVKPFTVDILKRKLQDTYKKVTT